MKFKLAIFDIDGTLVDTESTGVLSLVTTVEEMTGRKISYEEGYRAFGIPSAEVAPLFGYRDKLKFAERWEENYKKLYQLIKLFPGIEPAMEKVMDSGQLSGVVTSRSRYELNWDPVFARIRNDFGFIVCSEDSAKTKPQPEPALRCIELASLASGGTIHPQECIFLGDTEHDFQCARAAGCRFALADWKGRGKGKIDPDYYFTDAASMLEILGL